MSTAELLRPILDGGIRSNNFFNGRLLSAEDLSREQDANREIDYLLGKSVGEGIAYGFEVSKAAGAGANAIATVQPGLAINRRGHVLRLSNAVDLSLVRPVEGAAPGSGTSGFSQCTPFQSGVYVSGSGVYLLTVSPARGEEGRAPINGLQNAGSDCHTKYIVDGVQFRLIQLELSESELFDQSHLRNTVAYKCFGVSDSSAFLSDPFRARAEGYGLLDRLRPSRLTDCDVPLAVLNWTAGDDGIQFVDMWSVRRRIAQTSLTGRWKPLLAERRASEAEAVFLQFADQLESLRTPSPQSVIATDHFRFLPPVGILPLAGASPGQGFDYQTFFDGRVYRNPVFIEGSRLEHLVRTGMDYPPIELGYPEMVWLYEVRENRDPAAFVAGAAPLQYIIFASGHIPFHGEARFDVARWNYSNYS